jgi:hypothetical protein
MPAKFQMLTLSPSGLIANASDKTRALIRVIYKMAELQVKVQGRDGDTATSGTFSVDRGSPQGDGLSPLIWLLVLSSVLRKRDPALQKSWQENRKPGEYREGDKYICRGCGICAREYAAAPADPTDPDTTMESEEGSDESDAGSEEKAKEALEENPLMFQCQPACGPWHGTRYRKRWLQQREQEALARNAMRERYPAADPPRVPPFRCPRCANMRWTKRDRDKPLKRKAVSRMKPPQPMPPIAAAVDRLPSPTRCHPKFATRQTAVVSQSPSPSRCRCCTVGLQPGRPMKAERRGRSRSAHYMRLI